MDKLCRGLVQRAKSQRRGAEAVVDIVHVDTQRLVEPTQQIEDVAARGQAGACHRRALAGGCRHPQIPGRAFGQASENVAGGPGEAHDQPAVLEPTVRIEEPRPGGTDVGAERLGAQGSQPSAPMRLDVVVEEQQNVAARFERARIVERGPVEGPGIDQDTDIGVVGEAFDEYCERVPPVVPLLAPMEDGTGEWKPEVVRTAESKTFVTFGAMLATLLIKARNA